MGDRIDIRSRGFQSGWLKNADGTAGKRWDLVTCARDCACGPGCLNCPSHQQALVDPTMVVRELDDQLLRPLSWKRPYSVFACAEGDLFHKKISTAFIHKVFAVMESCPEHRFVLITKRAERMEEVLTDPGFAVKVSEVGEALLGERYRNRGPLWGDNIVIGVSVEDQAHMERSLILPRLPATMTKAIFVAPMLGPVTIPLSVLETLGWVLCNGERGNKWCEPRPCKLEWQQDLAFQCEAADVPFFLLRRLHRAWIEQLGGKRYLDLPKILTAA